MHSLVHKYSKLFYKDRVLPLVEAELRLLDHKASNGERLGVIRRLTAERWAQEDEETISQVTAALDVEKADKHVEVDANCKRTPEDYQRYVSLSCAFLNCSLTNECRAIDELPSVLSAVFDELGVTTGWSFTILMGGPYPKDGGSIQTAS